MPTGQSAALLPPFGGREHAPIIPNQPSVLRRQIPSLSLFRIVIHLSFLVHGRRARFRKGQVPPPRWLRNNSGPSHGARGLPARTAWRANHRSLRHVRFPLSPPLAGAHSASLFGDPQRGFAALGSCASSPGAALGARRPDDPAPANELSGKGRRRQRQVLMNFYLSYIRPDRG